MATKPSLKTTYILQDDTSDANLTSVFEIGVDEAGRGPMIGRVYSAAVILPTTPNNTFNHHLMKDSKRFHSKKKIREMASYIKENAVAWAVGWADENTIDEINIRRATHQAMHQAISQVFLHKENNYQGQNTLLLIDGNDFTPYIHADYGRIPNVCIEGGDNQYTCIAAASILAKVSRDDYIADLCVSHPELIERYDLLKNKGYGTQKHMAGIKQYGITPFHRKTFGICREFA